VFWADAGVCASNNRRTAAVAELILIIARTC
jgi:hypothetical protein